MADNAAKPVEEKKEEEKKEEEKKKPVIQQTFICIKTDGVHRGLIAEIIRRFEKEFKLVAMKLVKHDEAFLEEHYTDLKGLGFFPDLISYMTVGPLCAMVWEGLNAIDRGREILGATDPKDAAEGTIRADFAKVKGRNICHGSDGQESAAREIALWFPEGVISWENDIPEEHFLTQTTYFLDLAKAKQKQ